MQNRITFFVVDLGVNFVPIFTDNLIEKESIWWTSWCAGGSSWCYWSSKRSRILQRDSPHHRQPAFPQTDRRGCGPCVLLFLILVFLEEGRGWSRFWWEEMGRFQQMRVCLCRSIRQLPLALMQNCSMNSVQRSSNNTNRHSNKQITYLIFFVLTLALALN